MKKALCCILSFVICITLCGCNVLSELSSAFTEFLTDSDYGQIILMDEKVETYKIDPHPIDDNEIAFLYCYQQLDKEQKRIYKLIYSAVEKMQKGWKYFDVMHKDRRVARIYEDGRCTINYPSFITLIIDSESRP